MLILALDTASIYCAVALIRNKSIVSCISERMSKGHAEKLIGQIAQATNQANITLDQVDRIAVNIGPGSFTGVRIGVSTARALALALEIPAIGVNALEALATQANKQDLTSAITVVIEAGRGMFYHQNFNNDFTAMNSPSLKTLEQIISDLPQQTILTGPATDIIVQHLQHNNVDRARIIDQIPCEAADISVYANLAANKQTPTHPPCPLYLRDADAKQQINFALPRKK